MPLFEYRCSDCGKKSEELVMAGDTASAPTCPACGSMSMRRLLSTFAAHGSSKNDAGEMGDFPCGEGACGSPDACGMAGTCGAGGFGDSDF